MDDLHSWRYRFLRRLRKILERAWRLGESINSFTESASRGFASRFRSRVVYHISYNLLLVSLRLAITSPLLILATHLYISLLSSEFMASNVYATHLLKLLFEVRA